MITKWYLAVVTRLLDDMDDMFFPFHEGSFVSLLIYRVREKKKFVKYFKNITHCISGRYNYCVDMGIIKLESQVT